MITSLLTFLAVGVVTLIVAGIVFSILGALFSLSFGLATFLLFKVAPIMFVGWLVLKLIDRRRSRRLTAADRAWLED